MHAQLRPSTDFTQNQRISTPPRPQLRRAPRHGRTRDVHRAEIRTASDIMQKSFCALPSDSSLEEALWWIDEEHEDVLLVVNAQGDLVGLVDRFDLESAVDSGRWADDRALEEVFDLVGDGFHIECVATLSDIMNPYVHAARPHWPVSLVGALMEAEGLEWLPVVETDPTTPIGLIHAEDLPGAPRVGRAPAMELYGTFRRRSQLRAVGSSSIDELIESAEAMARTWFVASPVHPEHPESTTLSSVLLPIVTELYDRLSAEPDLLKQSESARREMSRLIHALRTERRPGRELLDRLVAVLDALRRRVRTERR